MGNLFDKPASTPSLSFSIEDSFGRSNPKPFGTCLGGELAKDPEKVQERGYAKGPEALRNKPIYWNADKAGDKTAEPTTPDGRKNNPIEAIVLTFKGAGDDGTDASIWVREYPKDMFEAVAAALTGNDGSMAMPVKGDQIWITLTGLRPVPGKNPAYTYTAEYIKGNNPFQAPPPSAATSVAAPPPPPPAAAAPPPPPAPPAEPVLSNGYTASALRAGGWTEEQIAALSAPVPAAAPTPAAAPSVPAADKMANLSAEDKAMLNI